MDAIENYLANYIVQRPNVVVIGHDIVIVLICLFIVIYLVACFFLAFGKQGSFYYRPGSIEGVGWKIGWMLMALDLVVVAYQLSTSNKHAGNIELIVMFFPLVLLLTVQLLGLKYHKAETEALRQERKAKSV